MNEAPKNREELKNKFIESYKAELKLRKEFSKRDNYIREKTDEEKAYHSLKETFGEFRPKDSEFMKNNDNNGKGAETKLPNGEQIKVNNQKELFDKIVEFNKKHGKFYDEEYIKNNNPDDYKRLIETNKNTKNDRNNLISTYNNKNEALKEVNKLEVSLKKEANNEVKNRPINPKIKKQEYRMSTNKSKNEKEEINEIEYVEKEKSKDKDGKPKKNIENELDKKFLIEEKGNHKIYKWRDSGQEVVRESNKKISTKSDSKMVAETMVKMAENKGWENIKAKGTENFRREIWMQASLSGMAVEGYKPTEQDKRLLEEKMNSIESKTEVLGTTKKAESKNTAPSNTDKKIRDIQARIDNDEKDKIKSKNISEEKAPSIADKRVRDIRERLDREEKAANKIDESLKNGERTINAVGTPEYKKELWIQGQQKGVNVKGYEPTTKDKEEVLKRTAQEAEALKEASKKNQPKEPQKDTTKTIQTDAEKISITAADKRVHKIQQRVDKENKLPGKEPTTSKVTTQIETNANPESKDAQKSQVEQMKKAFNELPKSEVVKKHPELKALYKLTDAANEFAKKTIANKESQQKFVDRIKDKGFGELEKGNKVPQLQGRRLQPQREQSASVER